MIRWLLWAALAVAGTLAFGAAGAGASDEGVIVYWSDDPFPTIWAMGPDGSDPHRLLGNEQNAKRPRLSPDRSLVAFDGASPGKAPLTDFDIQLVGTNGTGLRTLTPSTMWDLDAQWIPHQDRISFSRMPVGAVWRRS